MMSELGKELLLKLNRDIQVLKTYGAAPYGAELKKLEKEIKDKQQMINEKIGKFLSDSPA
jgi:26S proteasome regulatory subunit T1